MKFDEKNQKKIKSPFIVSMATVAVCPTDSNFVGLSRSTKGI
jgi:hypothetical protein